MSVECIVPVLRLNGLNQDICVFSLMLRRYVIMISISGVLILLLLGVVLLAVYFIVALPSILNIAFSWFIVRRMKCNIVYKCVIGLIVSFVISFNISIIHVFRGMISYLTDTGVKIIAPVTVHPGEVVGLSVVGDNQISYTLNPFDSIGVDWNEGWGIHYSRPKHKVINVVELVRSQLISYKIDHNSRVRLDCSSVDDNGLIRLNISVFDGDRLMANYKNVYNSNHKFVFKNSGKYSGDLNRFVMYITQSTFWKYILYAIIPSNKYSVDEFLRKAIKNEHSVNPVSVEKHTNREFENNSNLTNIFDNYNIINAKMISYSTNNTLFSEEEFFKIFPRSRTPNTCGGNVETIHNDRIISKNSNGMAKIQVRSGDTYFLFPVSKPVGEIICNATNVFVVGSFRDNSISFEIISTNGTVERRDRAVTSPLALGSYRPPIVTDITYSNGSYGFSLWIIDTIYGLAERRNSKMFKIIGVFRFVAAS